MLRGDTQTSTSETRRHRRETLRRWRRRAVPLARAVDSDLVTDLRVGDLELDERWSFAGSKKADFAESAERGAAWWHKAPARESRLIVEQFVSPRTPEAAGMLVNRSFDRLASGCLPRISSDGTAWSRNRYLVRKSYAFAKTVPYMDDQCEVDKTFYNFCRKHRGLKGETPAMRQGITDHVWSVAEVLGYRSAAP